LKIGSKVTYVTPYKKEHGIIKSHSDNDHVFVVYHYDNNRNEYFNYTGARTRKKDLKKGWI